MKSIERFELQVRRPNLQGKFHNWETNEEFRQQGRAVQQKAVPARIKPDWKVRIVRVVSTSEVLP